MASCSSSSKRGAFIVLEGLDRSGKSTQCSKLVDNLNKAGLKTKGIRFPDRTTTTGTMIDAYLKQSTELDDYAIHLLFAVNRWEKAKTIQQDLEAGTNIICDRYAFSGATFSAAKGLDYDWCKSPDIGLPAPDLVLFLSVTADIQAQRGGFGDERYEKSEMQERVRQLFQRIGKDVGPKRWRELDAGKSIEEMENEVFDIAQQLCQGNELGPIAKLWQ